MSKSKSQSVLVTYSAKMVPTERIRPFVEQPRKYFDPEEIAARAESMRAVGQQAAVGVEEVFGDPNHDYELIDGESRWRSAKAIGIAELLVLIRSVPYVSKTAKHLASLVANFNRSPHTPMEMSDALQVQVDAGLTQVELARVIGKDQMWVSQHLSLQKLHPTIKELLDPRTQRDQRIAPMVGVSLARVAAEQQLEVLETSRRRDGKVTKSRVDAMVLQVLGGKKRAYRPSASKRRASIEHALRSIGLGAQKVLSVAPDEAEEIFSELKQGGELQGIDSLEDLLLGLRQMKVGVEAGGRVFEGLPVLKEGANAQEVAAHEERLHEYWIKRAGPGDDRRLIIAIAYGSIWSRRPPRRAKNIFWNE